MAALHPANDAHLCAHKTPASKGCGKFVVHEMAYSTFDTPVIKMCWSKRLVVASLSLYWEIRFLCRLFVFFARLLLALFRWVLFVQFMWTENQMKTINDNGTNIGFGHAFRCAALRWNNSIDCVFVAKMKHVKCPTNVLWPPPFLLFISVRAWGGKRERGVQALPKDASLSLKFRIRRSEIFNNGFNSTHRTV